MSERQATCWVVLVAGVLFGVLAAYTQQRGGDHATDFAATWFGVLAGGLILMAVAGLTIRSRARQ